MEFNCRSLDKSTSIFFAFSTSSLGPRIVTLSEFASAAIKNYRIKAKKFKYFSLNASKTADFLIIYLPGNFIATPPQSSEMDWISFPPAPIIIL